MFFKRNKIYEPQNTATRLVCESAAFTDKGPKRSRNEDSLLVMNIPGNNATLAIVADGMGGHNAGDIASKMACEQVSFYIQTALQQTKTNYPAVVKEAIVKAHQDIVTRSKSQPELNAMGSTLTCVLIINNTLYLGHVGDSRLYHFYDNTLRQLSDDHTLVNDLYKRGEITETERDHHDMKNILTQALGTAEQIQPQIISNGIPVKHGDCFLLCSDGLYDVVDNNELASLLAIQNSNFALECITGLAYRRNAADNFTAVLLSFKEASVKPSATTKEILPQL